MTSSEPSSSSGYPLEGIRVLDLTVALAGPYCTLMLAGMGAEVIKIEAPGGSDIARTNPPFFGPQGLNFGAMRADDLSISMISRSRGKKSLTLDLKSDAGRRLFMKLAEVSDVVIENLSDGVCERLGVDYPRVQQANPRIVYASISGLGEPSPFPGLKAMDIIIQALSGSMEVTGRADGPPTRNGLPVGDLTAPLFATSGVLAALIQRGRTGRGQHVEVNLLDCLTTLLAEEQFDVWQKSGRPQRTGNFHDRLTPFGVYAASNGHVAIAAPTDAWMRDLFAAMNQQDLTGDPRFASRAARAQNADALNAIVELWTSQRTVDEVVDILLTRHRVPAAPVRTPAEAFAYAATAGRRSVTPLNHPTIEGPGTLTSGMPMAFSDACSDLDRRAPLLGEHNDEIYRGLLGLDETALDEMRRNGVI